jgi:uncharacterized membrane protein YhaH (DUF805 family)
MDFSTAVKTCLKDKYATFDGRARRSEYWWFALASFVIGLITGFIPVVGWLVSLALICPSIGVAVRRLHDVGKSGWWFLLVLVPLVGALVLIFFFYIKDSEPGANQYGPNPKEEA